MAILLASEAVDDFIERAVAAAGDDELAAFFSSAHGDISGVARARCFGEVGFNPAGCEDTACFIEFLATRTAAAAGVGVVNQKCVAQVGCSLH